MDDSFKLRVEKIFGSLRSSQSSSQPQQQQQQQRPPLWSISDNEVERKEWRRESAPDREDTLCSSSFDEFLKEERRYRSGRRKQLDDDLDKDDDDDDEDDDRGSSQSHSGKNDDYGDEWEIRSGVGMDSTLDNEDEEDEFDKVASGRENAGERLYMSDIADHGSFLNSHNILQRALNHTSDKDHCANHMAARIRPKEDDEEAQKLNSCDGPDSETRELPDVKASDNGCQLRSILKRKDTSTGFKPQKRVRFDCAYKNKIEEQLEKFEDHSTDTLLMNPEDSDGVSLLAENAGALPDYLRNPYRYTRYSFDSSSEVGEEFNAQAGNDVLKVAPNSKSTESLSEVEDAPHDLPKSVAFIPKRKSGILQLGSGASEVQEKEDECKKSLNQTRLPVGMAEDAVKYGEDDVTEDDIPEKSAVNDTPVIRKGSRSYRVKSQPEDLDLQG